MVTGTFLEFTAENIDSVGNRFIAGTAVIALFDEFGVGPTGGRPSHLLIARRIVQMRGVKYPASD